MRSAFAERLVNLAGFLEGFHGAIWHEANPFGKPTLAVFALVLDATILVPTGPCAGPQIVGVVTLQFLRATGVVIGT